MAATPKNKQLELKKQKDTKGYRVFGAPSNEIVCPIYISHSALEPLGSPETIKVTIEAG